MESSAERKLEWHAKNVERYSLEAWPIKTKISHVLEIVIETKLHATVQDFRNHEEIPTNKNQSYSLPYHSLF